MLVFGPWLGLLSGVSEAPVQTGMWDKLHVYATLNERGARLNAMWSKRNCNKSKLPGTAFNIKSYYSWAGLNTPCSDTFTEAGLPSRQLVCHHFTNIDHKHTNDKGHKMALIDFFWGHLWEMEQTSKHIWQIITKEKLCYQTITHLQIEQI